MFYSNRTFQVFFLTFDGDQLAKICQHDSNLVSCLILRRSLQQCRWIFDHCSLTKLKKQKLPCKGLFAWRILKTCWVLANFSYGKKRKHLLIRDQTESNSTQIKVFLQFCHTVNRSLKFNGSKILIINTTGVLDFTNINMFFAVTKDLCHKWCKQN